MSANARFWLIAILVAGGLVYLLAPILTPFVAAALLAYLGDPIVDRIERWHVGRMRLGRTGGVLLVFFGLTVLLAAALLVLVPMLEKQVVRLLGELPAYLAWFQDTALPWLSSRLGIELPALDGAGMADMFKEHWQSAGGLATSVLSGLSRSGMVVINVLINLLLIPVVAFYLLRDWDRLIAHIQALIPRHAEPVVVRLARESDQVLGAFLRGQLLVMLALAAIYAIGLSLIGLELALLIGIIAGLISFVPYLGAIVGVGMGVVASLFQFGELWHFVAVLIVFGVGQVIESVLLQPVLLGDRIGLHPVAVIFAVLAGGQLFGFLGVLLALPVAAVLMVLLRYALERYQASEVYEGGVGQDSQVVVAPEPVGRRRRPVGGDVRESVADGRDS